MKLQIAFDMTELEKALSLAQELHSYVDILEVGSLLLYKHGDTAIRAFKEQFPQKPILADMKIVDRAKETTTIALHAGADWVTVLSGTSRNVIHAVCATAHEVGKKVMLDLIDASSLGQSALESQSLGVDALLFHKPVDEDAQLTFLERWDMVKGNTKLPVFVSAPFSRDSINSIIALKPDGIVVSKAITEATDPVTELQFIRSLLE